MPLLPSPDLAGVIENHRFPRCPRFDAKRGVHGELTSRFQTETDIVLDRAGCPSTFGDARHRHKSHAGVAAYDLQACRTRAHSTAGLPSMRW